MKQAEIYVVRNNYGKYLGFDKGDDPWGFPPEGMNVPFWSEVIGEAEFYGNWRDAQISASEHNGKVVILREALDE